MRKLILGIFMLSAITMLPGMTYAQASTNQQTTDEIIKMVKAQWASEISDPTNVAEQFKNIADDYTEFNGDFSTRVDGKATNMRFAEGLSKDPGRTLVGEMLNPKVQVYGDVAILSYNYAGMIKNKDGETKSIRAKSTRVYAKVSGSWKLVHANFAPDPKAND